MRRTNYLRVTIGMFLRNVKIGKIVLSAYSDWA